jgi:hypothetical protein
MPMATEAEERRREEKSLTTDFTDFTDYRFGKGFRSRRSPLFIVLPFPAGEPRFGQPSSNLCHL